MSFISTFQQFINDTARQVQFFMICRQLGIIFSSIVIAWYLPVENVGVIEMLMFVGYLMTFFWSDALLRGFLANTPLQSDRKTSTTFLLLYFIGGLIVMAVLLIAQPVLIPLFTSRPNLQGLELFAAYQVLILPLWVAPFIGIMKGQNILLASLFVLIGPAFACWSGFTSLPEMSGILLGLFCYALVGFIWVLTQTTLLKNIQLKSLLIRIWPATWPLALYAISNGLARSFDAWLVARYFDESIFAIFRYGAREFPLVVALSLGLSAIMIPKLHNNQSVEELKQRSTRVMHSSYPIIILLMLLSTFLFELVYGSVYRESATIFNIYLLLTLTQLVFPQSIITARGDTKTLWYISLAELVINVVASLILLQYLGLQGIAWGTLIAFTFEKIALFYFIGKRYSLKPSMVFNTRVLAIYGTMMLGAFILAKWIFGI